ncbi:MAG: peptidoglycan-binding protein [Chromatiales bacterium]|nr:peptidoglycan-binding protein [Chromatiales bacterium]
MRTPVTLARVQLVRAVVIFIGLMLGASSGALAARVQYEYGSFALLHAPPSIAQLGTYQARLFDDALAVSRSISAYVDTATYDCPLAFQDAAEVTGNDQQRAVAVMGYRACPFKIREAAPESWITLREPVVIDIDYVEDGVAYVTGTSSVPFLAELRSMPFPSPTAIGVTWRFRRSGTAFTTSAGEFLSQRANATIEFTKRGLKFTGFGRVPTQAGVNPSTRGWAREAIRAVQEQLPSRGYKPGPVDGLWGSRTRDAIAAFQRASGIEVSGTLNFTTLDQLGI